MSGPAVGPAGDRHPPPRLSDDLGRNDLSLWPIGLASAWAPPGSLRSTVTRTSSSERNLKMRCPMLRTARRVVLVSFALLGSAGCSDRAVPTAVVPTAPDPPVASARRVIEVGQPVNGRISSTDPVCGFSNWEGGWEGLCNAFDITVPATGILSATVRWAADAPLALFLKTSAGDQIDLSCCNTPVVMQLPVDSGVTYRIELAYVGRPASYPQVPPVDYTLETALLPFEAQSPRALQAIVFGDPTRTQRLSHARLEVLDGPSAGTVARFDEATGLYEFAGLPAGFVLILASADGFTPLTERLPVGLSLPRELMLERREALLDATNTLAGVTWADASGRRSAWSGVKVEILDGPLAGVFTFTDEFFGMYHLKGLPPGLMQVRASSEWLQPQTLGVVVSGNTILHFFMQPR